jgi:uncharacterized glyoxalase superfamily protein PhnB
MAKSAPDGWHTVTPRVVVREPEKLVSFLKVVFGAIGEFNSERPAEMRIGDSIVMVSGDQQREAMTAFLYVYVDDADAIYRRALAAGAVSIEEPANMPYGDRRGMVRDAWGNTWQIASRQNR